MKTKKDISNVRFGKLVAIRFSGRDRRGNYIWEYRCDCGNVGNHLAFQVKAGQIKSCGCSKKGIRKGTNPLRFKFSDYKYSAKKRGISFRLSFSSFCDIVLRDCYYCGEKPRSVYRRYNIKYSGVDRMNSDIGYIKTNCVPCCKDCNLAKGKMSKLDFERWIKKVYKKLNSE